MQKITYLRSYDAFLNGPVENNIHDYWDLKTGGFWSYDLDLLGSRDVISHVTIGLATRGFLSVNNYNHTSNNWPISAHERSEISPKNSDGFYSARRQKLGNLPSQTGNFVAQQSGTIKWSDFVACLTRGLDLVANTR